VDRSTSPNVLKITIVGSGFPHSETSGSKPVRGSPELFAAYHVLHRLSVPRHPPNALKTLDRSHRRYSPSNRNAIGSGITTPRQTFPKGKMSSSSRDGSSRVCPRLAAPMISTRKTILLHHSSSASTPQDKDCGHKGAAAGIAPDRAPGDLRRGPRHAPLREPVQNRPQPDECLFTMSNNAATPERNELKALFPSRIPEKRSFLHADNVASPLPPQG
jgi:hypothetical protein